MTRKQSSSRANPQAHMPDAEVVAAELANAELLDGLFGKDGISPSSLLTPLTP